MSYTSESDILRDKTKEMVEQCIKNICEIISKDCNGFTDSYNQKLSEMVPKLNEIKQDL